MSRSPLMTVLRRLGALWILVLLVAALRPPSTAAQAIAFGAKNEGGTIEFSRMSPSITFQGHELAAGRTTEASAQTVTFETKTQGSKSKILQVVAESPLSDDVGTLYVTVRDFRVLRRDDQGGGPGRGPGGGGGEPEVTLLVDEDTRLAPSRRLDLVRATRTDVRAELRLAYVVALESQFVSPTTEEARLTYRFEERRE